jgi:type IV secretory pathway protease TraF
MSNRLEIDRQVHGNQIPALKSSLYLTFTEIVLMEMIMTFMEIDRRYWGVESTN